MKRKVLTITTFSLLTLIILYTSGGLRHIYNFIAGKHTVASRIESFGEKNRNVLKQIFIDKKLTYPPVSLSLFANKEEKKLEVWSKGTLIKTYKILKASGSAGPKLKRGDRQVPEGIYNLIGLNPNSRFYLSVRVNYPTSSDKEHSKNYGFNDPGDNIFIHGKKASVGCLALGDPAIEELFTLLHDTKLSNTKIIIAPNDLRIKSAPENLKYQTDWIQRRYDNIKKELLSCCSVNQTTN